jgi:hypothetical protein
VAGSHLLLFKAFYENLRNVPTNRKKKKGKYKQMRKVCIPCLKKSFVNSKAFGIKQEKTLKIQYNIKERVLAQTCPSIL